MIRLATRRLRSLRARFAILFAGGMIVCSALLCAVLVTTMWDSLVRELEFRTLAVADRVAREVALPMLVGDVDGLELETRRVAEMSDVIGVAILDARGAPLAMTIADSVRWSAPGPGSVSPSMRGASRRHAGRELVLDVASPVARPPVWDGNRNTAMLEEDLAPAPNEAIGRVHIAISTARVRQSVMAATRRGGFALAGLLALGFLVVGGMARLVVRPLGEASQLARSLAAGHLDRRIPVRGDDELGALAESMNTMAVSLADARRREVEEAGALRAAADAVIAVAQGVRGEFALDGVFRVVAREVVTLTHCDGVALVSRAGENAPLLVSHAEPPSGWGGLVPGAVPGAALLSAASRAAMTIRIAPESTAEPPLSQLAADGWSELVAVPLLLDGGVPAALVLGAREGGRFRAADLRIVEGLASHLSSALQAMELRHRLERTYEDLRRTQHQLRQTETLRATGELAAGVAHDFNNVLGAILGRIQLVQRAVRGQALTPADLDRALEVMELAARDGAETVRRLRLFSHGEPSDNAGPVELAGILADVVEFTRPRWGEEAEAVGRAIRVRVDAEPDVCVHGTPTELREVVLNLMLNAIDALPRGGVVHVASRPVGERAIVVVEDDGIGMGWNVQQRMFDPFFTTKGVRGTGLGLSVVYGIVQRLGGTISVRSTPGRGTRVEMSFPLAHEAPEAHPAPPPPPAGTPAGDGGLRVLVVDDEPAVRELLHDIITSLGHTAVPCPTGRDGLAAFEANRFDLVLTDLGLPDISGWAVARGIRDLDAAVTIVFVTGWGEQTGLAEVRSAGVDALVSKPFSIEEIIDVTQLASRRRAERTGGDQRAA